jgi:hypothetical protein
VPRHPGSARSLSLPALPNRSALRLWRTAESPSWLIRLRSAFQLFGCQCGKTNFDVFSLFCVFFVYTGSFFF